MLRSRIGKALGMLVAAVALIATAQSPASAATVAWKTSNPNLGNIVCSDPRALTTDSGVFDCLTWGGGKVRAYAMVYNTSNDARYLPNVTHVSVYDGTHGQDSSANACAASSLPGQSTRYCWGPEQYVTSGCINVFGLLNYYWYSNQVIWSPSKVVCA
ncbi:hypothetical protein [Yinghuangia seranimata]|uniref:hypothetical protein n=1 Tax=Yinghuangia seranimata TaxID=408067 RepID=UPI00248B23D9|nr:hypothetical protein [Yinghuangia seranimata]MDI2131475.1 hypothetical protein [Yinghuangia seranimata]